ncbi:PE-PGRS family protein [Mycobacterium tuberculosis]|nr:PE-PGRS family protein [Mycobacterium tuberculosis]CMM17669.1 PE-PGRS family protein [Mycobacterium tuberculosis]CMP85363.1 PE-PGRS family protein [Mycobacterium tuberculosis]CMR05233.1 PE-PGRS family protein [Mycobacterium tuberculosis]CMR69139.1 PE-PGRS family protein [Mycobacterium tuberculosis]
MPAAPAVSADPPGCGATGVPAGRVVPAWLAPAASRGRSVPAVPAVSAVPAVPAGGCTATPVPVGMVVSAVPEAPAG